MPKTSGKTKIINFLTNDALDRINWIQDTSSDDDDAIDHVFDDINEKLMIVIAHRRGVELSIPKSIQWRDDVLTQLSSDRFRQMLRVNRNQLNYLVSLICDDWEFKKPHAPKQFSVELQLAIVLFRLGSEGESASVRKIASLFGIGDGGTLAKITKRIFCVILKLLPQMIFWPKDAERSELVSTTYHELPFCIGYVDGTEMKLSDAPLKNHEAYFSRTHIYSLKVQAVCDHKLHIRDVVVGSPGSSHDAKIYRNCSVYKNTSNLFSNEQWIAGDSAYPLSETMITPYRQNSKHMDIEKRKAFNLRHSKYRVRVEHCFGLLKEKFCSLKELRTRIRGKESHKFCCDWILVCCILHNILLTDEEKEEYINRFVEEESEDFENGPENSIGSAESEIKRQGLYYLMFEN